MSVFGTSKQNYLYKTDSLMLEKDSQPVKKKSLDQPVIFLHQFFILFKI